MFFGVWFTQIWPPNCAISPLLISETWLLSDPHQKPLRQTYTGSAWQTTDGWAFSPVYLEKKKYFESSSEWSKKLGHNYRAIKYQGGIMGSWIRKPGWCIYNLSNALKPEQGILVLIKVIENRKIYEIISKDDSSLVCSCMTQMSLLFTKNKDNNMQGHIFGGVGSCFLLRLLLSLVTQKKKKRVDETLFTITTYIQKLLDVFFTCVSANHMSQKQ